MYEYVKNLEIRNALVMKLLDHNIYLYCLNSTAIGSYISICTSIISVFGFQYD